MTTSIVHDGHLANLLSLIEFAKGIGTCLAERFPATKSVNSQLAPAPRIAIVDDEPALRMVFSIALETAGLETREFTGPREFLEKRAVRPFDVLIVDLRMPGEMDGLELVEKVRKQGTDVPVILCSANVTSTVESKARSVGVQAVLHKPVSPRVLRETVNEALQVRS